MSRQKIIERENLSMARIYWKRPLALTLGKGVFLIDDDGKEYLDCTSNYGVAITGHCHPKVVGAIKKQAERLLSCHGTFYNDIRSEFLDKLSTLTPNGLDKAFLSNSGTEAVEFALKLARKSAGKPGIIAMMGAFHGKTMGSLSATWNKKYKAPFEPLVPGFKHVPYGRIERVMEEIDGETAAVIVEPIQGESGINMPPDDFLPALRDICTDKGILLIIDEIQTGLGRTGKVFAYEHWGVKPDILCLAKAIASGLPMGVTISREEVTSSLRVGDHSSTFGGGPLACAAASATLDILQEEKLPERAYQLGRHLMASLKRIKDEHKIIREVRGLGLMVGIELRFDILNILLGAIDRGVLLLDAGRNIVRLLPPLIIEKEQLNTVVSVIDDLLGEEEAARLRN